MVVDKQACLACTRQSFYLTVLLQCSTEPIGERTFNIDFVLGTLCKASGDPLVMNMSYFPSAPAPNGCPHYLASCHRRDKDSEGYPSNLCLCIASWLWCMECWQEPGGAAIMPSRAEVDTHQQSRMDTIYLCWISQVALFSTLVTWQESSCLWALYFRYVAGESEWLLEKISKLLESLFPVCLSIVPCYAGCFCHQCIWGFQHYLIHTFPTCHWPATI